MRNTSTGYIFYDVQMCFLCLVSPAMRTLEIYVSCYIFVFIIKDFIEDKPSCNNLKTKADYSWDIRFPYFTI